MKTFKFTTTINCNNCLSKVAPVLDAEKAIMKWKIDLTVPEKTLTVETESENSDKIIAAVKKTGFEIIQQ